MESPNPVKEISPQERTAYFKRMFNEMKIATGSKVFSNKVGSNFIYCGAIFFTTSTILMLLYTLMYPPVYHGPDTGIEFLSFIISFNVFLWLAGWICSRDEESNELFILAPIGVACVGHRISYRALKWNEIQKIKLSSKNGIITSLNLLGIVSGKYTWVFYNKSYRARVLTIQIFNEFFLEYQQWECERRDGWFKSETYTKKVESSLKKI